MTTYLVKAFADLSPLSHQNDSHLAKGLKDRESVAVCASLLKLFPLQLHSPHTNLVEECVDLLHLVRARIP